LGLDSTQLNQGFQNYNLTVEFNKDKYELSPAPVNQDFAQSGAFVIVSTSPPGRVSVGFISTTAIPATTALGTLFFKRIGSDQSPLVFTVNSFDINDLTEANLPKSFSTGPLDNDPPTLVSSDPPRDATNSLIKDKLVFTFSETVIAGTGSIQLKTAAGTQIESFDAANSNRITRAGAVVTIDPTADLTAGTSYVLSIPSGALKDAAGNSYAGTNLNFSTATAGAVDNTPPTLTLSTPASGTTSVAVAASLSLTFNEAVIAGTGNIELKTAAGTLVESFIAATSNRITRSGAVVTIDPTADLTAGTSYVLSIPSGAVKDAAGNSYAGTNLNFSTATAGAVDNTPPTLTLATPASGTTSVATNTKIVLKFSEAIALGNGEIRLLGAAGVLIQSFNKNSASAVVAGDTLTLSPSVELSKATTYSLQIPAGFIVDIAGNTYSGLASYQITTALPASVELTIATDRSNVDEGGTVNFNLSASAPTDSILSYTITGVTLGDLDGTPLSGPITLDSNRSARLTVKLKADDTTEGIETMVITVAGLSRSVTVNDTSRASITPQNLKGSFGNEVFLMTTGVDSVDGGAGIDTAFVNDVSTEFEFTRQGEKIFMAQKSSQNIDTLIGIERVEFRDRSVALDTDGGPGLAFRLYKAAFNREPDLPGMGYWISRMDQQLDPMELAQRFVDSQEFRSVYGTKPSNAEFVNKIYQNVLGRTADAAGYTWWVNKMNTDSSKTFAKVLADFSESTENKTALAGQLADGVEFLPWLG
jgi:methionine-rich copper-binding protein CopC